MRRKIFRLTLSMIISVGCVAQTIQPLFQTAYNSLNVYSKNFKDAFSFIYNQAALSSQQSITAGLYTEKRFLLKELNFYSFTASLPVMAGGIGFQADYFGFADYNQSKLGIAYGKKLGKLIDIGVQFDYNLFHITGYGNSGAMNFEVGMILYPSEKITIGLHIYNPIAGKLKNATEKLASVFKSGIGYEASDQVLLAVELIKEEDRPVYLNAGLQYAFAKQFFADLGIITAPISSEPYGGIGLFWKKFRVDISANYHPQLGFTPALSLLFGPKSKNGE